MEAESSTGKTNDNYYKVSPAWEYMREGGHQGSGVRGQGSGVAATKFVMYCNDERNNMYDGLNNSLNVIEYDKIITKQTVGVECCRRIADWS